MGDRENTTNTSSGVSGMITVAILLWMLQLLPFLMPGARLWGFNHLLFLPPFSLYAYLAGGIIVLALFTPPLNRKCERIFSLIADGLFSGRFHIKWGVITAIALIVFWMMRIPIGLLGDGYSQIYNIGGDLPVVFKWSDFGAIKVIHFISYLLPFSGIELGKYSYGLVSVLSGTATLMFYGLLTREFVEENVNRLFILLMLIFSGSLLLFFGYIENYPVIWPLIVGYLYFAIRFLKGKNNLLLPTIFILMALVLHLQVLFFLSSYAGLVLVRGSGQKLYRKQMVNIWRALTIIFVIGLSIFIWKYYDSASFRLFFMPFIARAPMPHYSLFSPSHILDMINEMLLLIPLLPIFLFLGWRRLRQVLTMKTVHFLAVFALGGLIFLFVIEPKLGMGRDWDLFSLCGLAPLLILSFVYSTSSGIGNRFYLQLSLLALLLISPYFAVNLSSQPSISRFEYLLDLDEPRSRAGYDQLGQYWLDVGDTTKAISLKDRANARFPAIGLSYRAIDLANQGRTEEAIILADSMLALDPYSVEAINMSGWINLKMGNYQKAINILETAVEIEAYNPIVLYNLALANLYFGRYPQSLEIYHRALLLSPEDYLILDGMVLGFYKMGQYDSVKVYALSAIKLNSSYYKGHEYIGAAAFMEGDYVTAKKHLTYFIETAPGNHDKSYAEKLLTEINNK